MVEPEQGRFNVYKKNIYKGYCNRYGGIIPIVPSIVFSVLLRDNFSRGCGRMQYHSRQFFKISEDRTLLFSSGQTRRHLNVD